MVFKAIFIGLTVITVISITTTVWWYIQDYSILGYGMGLLILFVAYAPTFILILVAVIYLIAMRKSADGIMRPGAAAVLTVLLIVFTFLPAYALNLPEAIEWVPMASILIFYVILCAKPNVKIASFAVPIHMAILLLMRIYMTINMESVMSIDFR